VSPNFLILLSNFSLILLFSMSCQNGTRRKPDLTSVSVDSSIVEKARTNIEAVNFEGAEKQLDDFLTTTPVSVFRGEALALKAQCRENANDWSGATALYSEALLLFKENDPRFAGQIFLRQSFAFEQMGDFDKAQTSLSDAEKRKAALSDLDRDLVLPARQASFALRAGRTDDALKLMKSIRQSMPKHLSSSRKPELANALLRIGTPSTQNLEISNLDQSLVVFEQQQVFLWQAIALEAEPESSRAQSLLDQTYQKFWQVVLASPTKRTSAARLLESLQKLRIYAGPEAFQKNISAPLQTRSYAQIEKDAEILIYQIEDSIQRNKKGIKAMPPKIKKAKDKITDPNLETEKVQEP
jgi:hypothetical protein